MDFRSQRAQYPCHIHTSNHATNKDPGSQASAVGNQCASVANLGCPPSVEAISPAAMTRSADSVAVASNRRWCGISQDRLARWRWAKWNIPPGRYLLSCDCRCRTSNGRMGTCEHAKARSNSGQLNAKRRAPHTYSSVAAPTEVREVAISAFRMPSHACTARQMTNTSPTEAAARPIQRSQRPEDALFTSLCTVPWSMARERLFPRCRSAHPVARGRRRVPSG